MKLSSDGADELPLRLVPNLSMSPCAWKAKLADLGDSRMARNCTRGNDLA
jgi:hypothetical protein